MTNVFIALGGAFILGTLFTYMLIPFLKKHQFKQFVREAGPESHMKKTGTPSMGGIAIVGAAVISSAAVAAFTGVISLRFIIVLATGVLFGVIGFIDDYEKAIKKNNKGISPKQKIVLQVLFSGAFAAAAYFLSGSEYQNIVQNADTSSMLWIPVWNHYINLGILYIPWVMFIMVAFSNSVNLTDGLDGLASSVTAIVSFCMAICGSVYAEYADYPIIYGAVIGACLGFIVFNHYPAKIFMGDTGSMALGGILAATAIMMKLEIIVAIAGLLYVCEALSVIIQVAYFKKTGGKRIFRMAPLHHHFELGGMHETKVVVLFDAITLGFCIIAIIIMII